MIAALLTGCGGPKDPEARGEAHRLLEELNPNDRWEEIKSRVGHEYRNVLFTPYHSAVTALPVQRDGTFRPGDLVDPDKLSPHAAGLAIAWEAGETKQYQYAPVPPQGGVDALRGIVVRGVFPPTTDDTPRMINAWIREVIEAPKSRIGPVHVPPKSRLRFGIALEEPMEKALQTVRFVVGAESSGKTKEIYTRTLTSQKAGESVWTDVDVDLSSMAGQDVVFTFETEAETKNGRPSIAAPLWSDPVIHTAKVEEPDDRSNLILISLDTLRADHLGTYGYERDTSPNIDRIMNDGYLFERCIAGSSWTTPSHSTIFTGLHPAAHGAGGLAGMRLRNHFTTLAELARQEGYLTAAYTEGVAVGGQLGFYQGFDTYSNGAGVRPSPPGTSEKTFGRAKAWLENNGDVPFFMFVHTYEIHWPYDPPGEYFGKYTKNRELARDLLSQKQTLDNVELTDEAKQELLNLYDGGIAYTDEVVGDFFDYLKREGFLENTIVMIMSDHGEAFWEHGSASHGLTLYHELLHVPFYIRLPGENPQGRRIAEKITLADGFATAVELMGLEYAPPFDSKSLVPLLGVPSDSPPYKRDFISSELVQLSVKWLMISGETEDSKYIATTDYKHAESPIHELSKTPLDPSSKPAENEMKIMQHLIDGGRDWWKTEDPEERNTMFMSAREELFNLTKDPMENEDLSLIEVHELDGWRRRMMEYYSEVSDDALRFGTDVEGSAPLTQAEKEELGALGYNAQ